MTRLINFLYNDWQRKVFYIFLLLLLFIFLKIGIKAFYNNFENPILFIEFFRDFAISYFVFYFTLVYIKMKQHKKELNKQLGIVSVRLTQLNKNESLKSNYIDEYKKNESDLELLNNELNDLINHEALLETFFLYLTAFTALITFISILFK